MTNTPLERPVIQASESRGEFLGLEGQNAIIVAASWIGAMLLTTMMKMLAHASFVFAIPITFGPAAMVTFFILKLVNGKPEGYAYDWISDQLNWDVYSRGPRRHPRKP